MPAINLFKLILQLLSAVLVFWHSDIRLGSPAGPGFPVKRPIRKQYLGTALHSWLILLLLASRIWRARHGSVNSVHDSEKQCKSLSVAHRPGGSEETKWHRDVCCVVTAQVRHLEGSDAGLEP